MQYVMRRGNRHTKELKLQKIAQDSTILHEKAHANCMHKMNNDSRALPAEAVGAETCRATTA
jgi:hypothetical protein